MMQGLQTKSHSNRKGKTNQTHFSTTQTRKKGTKSRQGHPRIGRDTCNLHHSHNIASILTFPRLAKLNHIEDSNCKSNQDFITAPIILIPNQITSETPSATVNQTKISRQHQFIPTITHTHTHCTANKITSQTLTAYQNQELHTASNNQ